MNALNEITRNLILAKKRMGGIPTVRREIKPVVSELRELSSSFALPSIPSLPIQAKMIDRIDFGKLNPLINDQRITAVECLGAGKKLLIRADRLSESNISLTEKEILEIILKFSMAANVSVAPIFKASVNNLAISAFISPAFGAKFLLLKKI